MKDKIIHLIETHPKNLISFLGVFAILVSIGMANLGIDYSQKSWFRSGDILLENYEKFKSEYGSDGSLILILSFKDNVFKEKNLKRVYNFTEDLWTIPNFTTIDSLTNYSHTWGDADQINIDAFIKDPSLDKWTKEYLEQRKLKASTLEPIQNYLISKDQKSVAIYGILKNVEGEEGKVPKIVIGDIKEKLFPKYIDDDLKIMITGPASIGDAFQEESIADMIFIMPIAFGALFLILFLFLRNLVAAIISMGLISITLYSTLGIQGFLGIKSGLITGMCPLIILAICIVDIVHIFSTYFRAYEQGLEFPLRETLNRNLFPTFLTSVTTAIGFISFSTSELLPIAHMGLIASIGIVLAWTYTIFLVCPLLHLIPLAPKFLKRKSINILGFLPDLIISRPRTIVAFFLSMTIIATFFSFQNQIDSNMQNYFSKETSFRKSTDFFKKHIGGTNSVEIILQNSAPGGIKDPIFLKKVDKFIEEMYLFKGVTKINSIVEQLKQVHQILSGGSIDKKIIANSQEEIAQELFFLEISLPPEKSIARMFSTDKKDIRLTVFWNQVSSLEIKNGTIFIEKLIQKHGMKGHITGVSPLISGLDGYLISSFIESMLMATVSIALFMIMVFRSVFFGLISLIPNIIVPTFGAAVLYLTGRPFDGSSVLLFSICLGIAIDDTIYFLTNFQVSYNKTNCVETSIKNVLNSAGKTLSVTTLILVATFGLFYLGSFIPNQSFAIATTVILSSALVLDLTFLPAIMLLVGRNKFLKRFLKPTMGFQKS